jgi:FLVCR family feline leukemia virus subgroup C receptor-related protein
MVALTGAGLLGFFLMGAGPLGYQYAAELSHPVAETVSQGLLSLNSEFIGVFLVLFTTIRGGAYLRVELFVMLVAAVAGALILFRIKESPVIITEDERLREAVKKEIVHLV